jgi:hypothetical protein
VPANDRHVATDISNSKTDSASDIEKKSAKGTSNSDNIATLQSDIENNENNKLNVVNLNSVENT